MKNEKRGNGEGRTKGRENTNKRRLKEKGRKRMKEPV
jgi:hypothetical protein